MTEPSDKPASARQRLLDAASHLFYDEGVHPVGVDRIVERALARSKGAAIKPRRQVGLGLGEPVEEVPRT